MQKQREECTKTIGMQLWSGITIPKKMAADLLKWAGVSIWRIRRGDPLGLWLLQSPSKSCRNNETWRLWHNSPIIFSWFPARNQPNYSKTGRSRQARAEKSSFLPVYLKNLRWGRGAKFTPSAEAQNHPEKHSQIQVLAHLIVKTWQKWARA
jgi:hypothetical protein